MLSAGPSTAPSVPPSLPVSSRPSVGGCGVEKRGLLIVRPFEKLRTGVIKRLDVVEREAVQRDWLSVHLKNGSFSVHSLIGTAWVTHRGPLLVLCC